MPSLLVSIVGASGVGKTSLARALLATGRFTPGLETHAERPYQARLAAGKNVALANQIDFLLFRAEQEHALRASGGLGLLDGGLDLDFHGFTQLFHARGLLDNDGLSLCRRMYRHLRTLQPGPELFIHLTAPAEVTAARQAHRERINIATPADSARLAGFVTAWLDSLPPERVLTLDASRHDPDWSAALPELLNALAGRLAGLGYNPESSDHGKQ